MKFKLIILFILFFANTIGKAHAPQNTAGEKNYIKEAIIAKNNKQWGEAFRAAELSDNKILKKIIAFNYYLTPNNNASFSEIINFISENPSWPSINNLNNPNWPNFTLGLKVAAEKALNDENFNAAEVKKWFSHNPPQTTNGYKYYLKALGLNVSNYLDLIDAAWINSDFTDKDEKKFLELYGKYLDKQTHMAKVDKLLWAANVTKAKSLLKFLNERDKKIANTVISLIDKSTDAKKIYNELPPIIKHDSLVLYYYLSRDTKGDKFNGDTLKLIFKAPIEIDHARKWWLLKSIYVRYFMQHKNFKNAYKLATSYGAKDSVSIAEAEFLCGWIALTKLNKPALALAHFTNLHNNVSKSISLSRASYWIARCYQKKSNNKLANDWFRKAAKFNWTFYGQLALIELKQPKLNFHNQSTITTYNDEVFKALKILVKYDTSELPALFAMKIIDSTQDTNRIASTLELLKKCDKTDLVIKIAREAAGNGIFLLDYAFPKPFEIKNPDVNKPLIYSIIRQESSFRQKVDINEDGMMQVIPTTAERVSKHLKIPFDLNKIKNDFEHNIKIGSTYLKMLKDYYGGSYVLTISAYNAGENAVDKWIGRYGDPLRMKDTHQVVDWLENIPYFTTRNYAQRVMENMQIYQYIGGNKTLSLKQDLITHRSR